MLPEQNLPWWRSDRPWGFRFSVLDAVVLAVGVAATIAAWQFVGPSALVFPYLLGHFLLFCNTFRIGGERTLIWMGTFVANMYFWPRTENIVLHLIVQAVITATLVVQCVLGKNYHGIACARINPSGYRRGAMSEGAFTRRVLLACRVPRPVVEALIGRRLDEFEPEP